jgi:hypothetical protein
MNTNRTTRTTRFAAFMLAVLMTVAINGAMLWKFDTVAQEGVPSNDAPAAVVTLETANVIAPRS